MAKQKGLHQIKGKVGDMSYYQTAGVPGGLIRRIPEGLSSRVKTADEYANTRLNNEEFKNAAAIASFAFNAVPNRKSSMMRRFAVAEMIKEALRYIKEGSGNWGQRIPSATFDNIITDLLENHAKMGPYSSEYGTIIVNVGSQNEITVEFSVDAALVTELQSKGIDGLYYVSVRGAMAEVVNTDGQLLQYFGVSSPDPHDETVDGDFTVTALSFTPSAQTLGLLPLGYVAAQSAANNGMFGIISILPYRTVGSSRHILQELSTFVAIPLGAIPTT